ncbi:MAG TPA: transporter, partial [Spirochaetota bacterium]|nr:transporter [Spirochaetota bacterium]
SASCDEIILTSEYNRHLIANASAGSGIAHIINELIDVNSNVHIATISPPHELIGKRYSDVIKYYSNENNIVIIGILENTGNFYLRKMEAISEAQKTPDISRLVEKLKSVKNMSANRPVINPSPDFIIGKYSKIIMIQGRGA